MDSSPTRRPGPRRTLVVFGAGFAVLAVVVGSMFSVYRSGQWTLNHAREVVRVDAFWNWAQSSAVLALHTYALSGDDQDLRAYEAAMALPRAMRPSIQVSWEHPGDGQRMREAIASEPLIAGEADYWGDWTDRRGAYPEAVQVARARFQKDSLLQVIETEAEEVRRRVAEQGPGSPEVQEIVHRIRDLNVQINQITSPLFGQLADQEAAAEASMERSMRIAALSLLLGGGLLVGFLVARARRAEGTVVESEARFRQMAESVQEVFWLAEASTRRLLYVSPAYASIWGRPVADLYKTPNAWLEGVHPDDRERVREAWTGGRESALHQEYRVLTPSGDLRHVRSRAFPVRDERGKVIRFAGVAEDVTRRKVLEDELVQSQKLKSVGRLAGGVAHEFNNLLTVIQGHLLLLLADRAEDEELVRELDEALRATRTAGEVTRNLLSFAGNQMLLPRPLELARFVRDSERMVRGMLPDAVRMETWLEEGITVEADPSFLHEILLTLTTRALEAMPDGGVLRLEVEGAHHARRIPVEGGTLPEGTWGMLTVADTGETIPDDVRDGLFEPFGPLHDGPEDARLELASVFGIVDQSGGGIRVESMADGGGSRFTLYLPRIEGDEDSAAGIRQPAGSTSAAEPS